MLNIIISNIKFRTAAAVLAFIISLIVVQDVHSKITVTSGSREKKLRFIQMLQNGSFVVQPPAGMVNFDTTTGVVTLTGTPSNFFGRTLKRILDDTSNIRISLDKSVNGRPILIGGFNGGINQNDVASGLQSIDINDLNKMDSMGVFGVGAWQTFIMHELTEQFIGYKYGLTYSQAHDSAIAAEEEMIFSKSGQRFKRETDFQMGDTIYLVYRRSEDGVRVVVKFPLNQFAQIAYCDPAIIDELKTRHISAGCGGGLCGFNEGANGIIYEPVPGTELLAGAEYLTADEKGNIYASIPLQGKVVRMNADGTVDREYLNAALVYPAGMAYDPVSEELFVGCGEMGHIVVFDVSGSYKRTLTTTGLDMIAGMDIDPEGNIYIASHGTDSIVYMTPFGEVIGRIGHSQLQGPAGIIYADGMEKLFVVSNTNNKILMFNKNGSYAGQFASETQLSSPWGINIAGGKFDKVNPIGPRYTPIERIAVTNAGTNGIIVFNPNGSVKGNYSQPGFQPKAMLITRSIRLSPIGIDPVSEEVPSSFSLHQNYPNPFNPSTKIKFSLTKASFVKLAVFDIQGKELSVLVNDKLNTGIYEIDFNGSGFASGVYFYKIAADGFTDVKKMILVK
jgi:hypothetical protein